MYDLIGFSENRGNDLRPQYVTVVKHAKTGLWSSIDDTNTLKIDGKSAMESQATLLFYKRRVSATH